MIQVFGCYALHRLEKGPKTPIVVSELELSHSKLSRFGSQKWQAGIGDESAREGGIRLIEGSFNIQIPGFRIDVVDEVVYIGGPYSAAVGQEDRGSDGNTTTFLEKDALCLALTQRCFGHVNDALDAYARTLIVNSWISGLPIQLSQSERVQNAYEDCKAYLTQKVSRTTAADVATQQLGQQYITQLGFWQERPFYTTKNGRIGRGAFNMREGDAVCVFYQAGPVFILRHEQGSGVWKLIGDAYLHGCMDLDSMPEAGRGSDTTFIIS